MTPKIDKIFRKVLSGELCANFGGPAGGSRTLTGAELQNLIAPLWRPSRKAWFAGGARLFFFGPSKFRIRTRPSGGQARRLGSLEGRVFFFWSLKVTRKAFSA